MISKVSYMCGSILFEYLGTRNDRDEMYLKDVFVRANISCSSKIELPYFTPKSASNVVSLDLVEP